MVSGSGTDTDRGSDEAVETLLDRLHDHLAATAERPVERGASRWLGEAEAVAADVAVGDAPVEAIETRVRQVRTLLSHVTATGDPEADEHLAAARELVTELEDQL